MMSLRILGIEEGEVAPARGPQNVFNNNHERIFCNMKKAFPIKVKGIQNTNQIFPERNSWSPKNQTVKILKAAREEDQTTNNARPNKNTTRHFSGEPKSQVGLGR